MADLRDFGGWPLADLLTPQSLAAMRGAARAERYADGALVHSRGGGRAGLSLIREGRIRFGFIDEAGDKIEMSILGPGHCFGEATVFAGLARAYDAWAEGDAVIDFLSKPALERLMAADPGIAEALLVSTTRRLYATLAFTDDLRRLPLHAHAAKILMQMAQSSDEAGVVVCNQTDLADTFGVSRVSIGKALARLQDEGLIALGYGRITIADEVRLRDWLRAQGAGESAAISADGQ